MYYSRNQQTCISDNHNKISASLIFNPGFCRCFIVDFANATRVLMCQSNRQKLENMKNELK